MKTIELLSSLSGAVADKSELQAKIDSLADSLRNCETNLRAKFPCNIDDVDSQLERYIETKRFTEQVKENILATLDKLNELVKTAELGKFVIDWYHEKDAIDKANRQIHAKLKNLAEKEEALASKIESLLQGTKDAENLNKKLKNFEESFAPTQKKLDTAKNAAEAIGRSIGELNDELTNLVPSLKAGKLVEKFTTDAQKYEQNSWSLLIATVLVSIGVAVATYFSLYNVLDHITAEMNWEVIVLDMLIRTSLVGFGIYIVYFLSSAFTRNRNLEEEYKHKAALGDYYLSMKNYVETIIEDDEIEPAQKGEYLKYLHELSVIFTQEIAVPPRNVHFSNKSAEGKLKTFLNLKKIGSFSVEKEDKS